MNSKHISLPASKSLSNRYLILQVLHPQLMIENLSDANDTAVLKQALETENDRVDVGDAGTAMRFLTAYCSTKPGRVIITGSARMQQRPIKDLVDCLVKTGAEIKYLKETGYPPLEIVGTVPKVNELEIDCTRSSQYATALLLCSKNFGSKFTLNLTGEVVSASYIDTTIDCLRRIGYEVQIERNTIKVYPSFKIDKAITVESDWSGAGYFYSALCLGNLQALEIKNLSLKANQPDAIAARFYKDFGIESIQQGNHVKLQKMHNEIPQFYTADLINAPDLGQTLIVTLVGLRIPFKITGLQTLKIKETDRLKAMQLELKKLGVEAEIAENSIWVKQYPTQLHQAKIETYGDHRMAMAFAPLQLRTELYIFNQEVVNKSFPNFWSEFQKLNNKL